MPKSSLAEQGQPGGLHHAAGRWEELTSLDGYGEATHRPHLRILGGHVPPRLPTGVDVAEGSLDAGDIYVLLDGEAARARPPRSPWCVSQNQIKLPLAV